MTPKFLASIHDGKFIYAEPELLAERIKKLNGKEVYITIVKKTKSRSSDQNRYYWGCVLKVLASEIGELEEDMDVSLRKQFLETYIPQIHDGLKIKFLTDRSKKFPVPKSTTELSTVEFEEFLSKVRIWASSELNIYIPLPNEYDY